MIMISIQNDDGGNCNRNSGTRSVVGCDGDGDGDDGDDDDDDGDDDDGGDDDDLVQQPR